MSRRVLRWALRVLVALVALVVVAAGATIAVLHTAWGRERVRRQIEAKLQPYFPAGARVGRVEGSVFGDLVLRDIVLRDQAGRPAVTIARAEVNLALLDLVHDQLRVEKAIVEGAVVELHQHDGEPPNLATMYQPSPEPMDRDLVIERLEVRTAAVTLERDGRIEHVDDLTVLAGLRMTRDGAMSGHTDVTARWRERAMPIDLAGEISTDPAANVVDVARAKAMIGDVLVDAHDVHIGEGNDLSGALHVVAPRGALLKLLPDSGLPPTAIELDAALIPVDKNGMRAVLRGKAGSATVLGALSGRRTPERISVGGTIMVRGADARDANAALPATNVDSTTVVALAIDPRAGFAGLYGTLGVDGSGTIDALHFDKMTAGVTFAGGEVRAVGEARGDGDTWVRGAGVLTVVEKPHGRVIDLRDGTIVAHSTALERAAKGRIPLAGTVDATLAITGRLLDEGNATPQIAVRGTLGGQRLRRRDVRVRDLDVALALDGIPARPGGNATVHLRGARVGADVLPDLDATARGRMGGGFAVSVHADDRARQIRGRVDAEVTLPRRGATIATVEIGSYAIEAKAKRITGRGGRVVVGKREIIVREIRGNAAGGTFAIDAVAPRRDPTAIAGVVTVDKIDLAELRGLPGMLPTMHGTLGARLVVERGHARAHVSLGDQQLGNVAGLVDVTLPRHPEDPVAWRALDRSALRELQIDAHDLDLAAIRKMLDLQACISGRVDGSIHLGAGAPTENATIHARNITSDRLPAPADVDLHLDFSRAGVAGVEALVTLRTIGTARATGAVRAPARIFDAGAWQRLGVGAIEHARLQIDRIVLDERLAAFAGIPDVRGVVSVDLRSGRALSRLDGRVTMRDLHTGRLVEPASVTLIIDGDHTGMHGELTTMLAGATVATATLSTPRDLVGMIGERRDLAAVPITGTLSIVDLDIRRLGRAFGRRDIPTGRVHGTGNVMGTIGAPRGDLTLTVEHLAERPGRRAVFTEGGIRTLLVNATYAGGRIHVTAGGRQDEGGRLDLTADARLDALDATEARLVTHAFELRPLGRIAPGKLFGIGGKVDADLRMRGVDPATATVLGSLNLREGVVPIDDTVGVLREATAHITFAPSRATVSIGGKLGIGTVSIDADATLDGLLPRTGTLVANAKGIEIITSTAPRISGELTAKLERTGDTWNVTAAVRHGSVRSRVTSGRKIHPSGMPDDLVFASTAPGAPTPKPPARAFKEFVGDPPRHPFAKVVVRIYSVGVDVPRLRGEVGGRLDITVGTDGALVEGKVDILHGDVIVLERRYRLRRATVTFDGGLDPLLDLQLERELPELTLYANIRGRSTVPELTFSSDPATYTQGQLLAFAISDTASSAGSETTDAAANLFAAVATEAIVGVISPIIPIHLDVIAFEPASASSSRAFVFGRWITRRLLVLYRNRAEAHADENVNEAEIEYWLGRRVLFEGTAGDRGILGADLLWTRRW